MPPRRGRHLLWQVPLYLVGEAFLYQVLSPNRPESRDCRNEVKSQSNLRQIGQAILMYTQDYAGAYPDALPTLIVTEDITSEVMVSPSTSDTPATGPTTRAVADAVLIGGHCSYVYLGRGWNPRTVTANTVVAYEPPANLRTGGNVLFGDGSVTFCSPR